MSGLEVLAEDRSGAALDLEAQRRRAVRLLARLGYRSGELGLFFVGLEEMETLNRQHMGRPGPTDVLTFPLDAGEAGAGSGAGAAAGAARGEDERVAGAIAGGAPPVLLGDIVICPQVAADQAAGAGHSPEAEICLLLVHGMLHLAGYDHEADSGEMNARQTELTEEFCQEP